jgi:hypothetical protein
MLIAVDCFFGSAVVAYGTQLDGFKKKISRLVGEIDNPQADPPAMHRFGSFIRALVILPRPGKQRTWMSIC